MRWPDRLRLAPDPDDARQRFDRLAAAGLLVDALVGDAAEVVWIACAQAPYLAMLAACAPDRLLTAAADPFLRRQKPKPHLAKELAVKLAGVTDDADFLARLRAFRAVEYIRLGARECGLGDPAEVGRELSHLADVCVDAAVAFHDAELTRAHGTPMFESDDGTRRRAHLVVMGMGKLGGEELNFSSDIDVIYAYSSDRGEAGDLSLHEYFDRVARRVTRTIGLTTEDDIVFRVDLRLRPEGQRGPLVNSLPSLERYYESWGRAWERQAWLKARPIAGSIALGEEILAVLEPFIYPRITSPTVIADVADLNRRIKAELAPGRLETGYDVKVGVGGIREIEFFAQALQLVHAGKNRGLRERNTRRALARLFFAGHVAERERRALADAYDFLRLVEHRLQLLSGRQTHRLPAELPALEALARRLGCADAGELSATLERHTLAVATIFATLGDERPLRPEIAVLLDASRSEPEIVAALAGLGWKDAPSAAFQLDLMRRKPGSPFGPGGRTPIGAAFLAELAASPDPDQALRMAVDFVARGGSMWRLLEDNRPLLRLLASLFGTSAFLAKSFVAHPELLDMLLLVGRAEPRRTRAELERVAHERLAAVDTNDPEAAWNALRRLKNEELLRIGLADVAGDFELEDVTGQLSDLADVCVARTFDLIVERAAASTRRPPGEQSPPGPPLARFTTQLPRMAVLGLGKLGACELGYASDLDVIFVYDGDEPDDHELATKIAQRLVHALSAMLDEGRLYEVDTRLRPSGRKGTLVSSLAAWRRYHAHDAQLWERQALIKCRAVAGDEALGRTVEDEAQRFVYSGTPDAAAVAHAVLAMRERMERELGHEGNIKAGRGGLVDVEFAAQVLQLVHGPAIPGLRTRATLPALAAAVAAGVLAPAEHEILEGGYRFLRRVENRLRIVHDRPIHEYPSDPAELDRLARRAGFPSAGALDRAYLSWTRDVRACTVRLFQSFR